MHDVLTKNESRRRNQILNGNVFKVLLYISLPSFLFSLFNAFYTFFDAFIISNISDKGVSAVMFFDQIKNALSSLGIGIALGGCVIVARHFGANEIKKAREAASKVFYLIVVISFISMTLFIVLAKPILYLVQTPVELINEGLGYFIVQIVTVSFTAGNIVYFSLERAKGNTAFILVVNIIVMLVKIFLTLLFVFVFNFGLTSISVATLLSQVILFGFALVGLTSKKNSLRLLSFKFNFLAWKEINKIIVISIPIVLGKFMFSFGKVIVNSFSVSFYGDTVVGALGISGTIINFPQLATGAFEETLPSVCSQNFGNKRLDRVFKFTRAALLIAIIYIIVLLGLQYIFLDELMNLYNTNSALDYVNLIKKMYFWNQFDTLVLWLSSILIACLYGFGATKIATVSNIARLFIFRIPLIFIFYYVFNIGPEAAAIAMFASNALTMIIVVLYYFIFKKRLLGGGEISGKYAC